MTHRTTQLLVKRPWYNRLSWWLYDKFCGEIFIPEGRLYVMVKTPKPDSLNDKKASIFITIKPKKFVPGIHEIRIFDQLYKDGDEIKII